jgi:hypothetical protein
MAAWWTLDPDEYHEYENMHDPEYRLRDPHENVLARRNRYIKHISDAHGVDDKAATNALKHVFNQGLGGGFGDPKDYGFASSANQMTHYPHSMRKKLMDPKTWAGKQAEDIPLHQEIHASQNFIRPDSVAHNLFHPGKRQASEDRAVGDPDYDPSWDEDAHHEEDGESESTPEERALHGTARFMRRNNGSLEVVDGHHRVASDMLLGKPHTRGVVLHERDL